MRRTLMALVAAGFLCGCAADGPPTVLTSAREVSAAPAAVRHDLAEPSKLPDRVDLPLAERDGYLLIPGYLNGEPIGMMMIDTGASLGVVAQGVAGRLGLEAVGQGRTMGVGGYQNFDYLKVDEYSIGSWAGNTADPSTQRGRLKLTATRMAGLALLDFGRSMGVSLGGIVSYTDLKAVPFTLDAPAATLSVYHPNRFRPPAGASRHRLLRYRGLPMIRAELDDNGRPVEVWLILDFGADNALTLPTSVLAEHPGVVAVGAAGSGRTRGIGGSVSSTQTWARRLKLFGLDLEHLPINFEPPPPTLQGERPIGRVGNRLLRHFRLTFHDRNGYVYAQWVPSATPDPAE